MMFFIIIILIGLQSISFSQKEDSLSVYLIKQRWHTGIVIKTADTDTFAFPHSASFKKFKYIDAGWGDDEFYRHPDFDLGLAIKALFVNTPSTIRIEGFNFEIEKYIELSDIGFEVRLDRNSYNNLCRFINSTFITDSSGIPQVIESRFDGNIIFYKAKGKYNLLNTCNTWVAKAFNFAGMKISTKVILSEQLFDEVDELKNSSRLK